MSPGERALLEDAHALGDAVAEELRKAATALEAATDLLGNLRLAIAVAGSEDADPS